jgi:L,D-peptidoglycan transpeptidase YkuD (ErfK/YbiS/YcfS/YnhG family)
VRRDLVVDRWGARFGGRRLPCAIGRGGIVTDKREGDGATPRGVWRVLEARWRADRMRRPRLAPPLRPIGPRDGWCDASGAAAYNRPVRLPCPVSAERLRRGDRLYDLLAVLDHNAAGRPGAGSAIFLHCWRGPRRPTAGCVAFRRADLARILAGWTPRSRVVIR